MRGGNGQGEKKKTGEKRSRHIGVKVECKATLDQGSKEKEKRVDRLKKIVPVINLFSL